MFQSKKIAEVPSKINLSQINKNNDGIFMVGNELIPDLYKVELTDTKDIEYVERYNSKEMGTG